MTTISTLTATLQEFLSEAAGAVVLEDGAVAFDLAQSKYSISGEHGKCLLHLWSAGRNTVRRVLEAEVKSGTLRLAVQRSRPPTTFSSPVSNPSHYGQEIVFGVGAEERVLDHRNWTLFEQLVRALRDARHPYGPRGDRLFRLHPERWLESLVRADVSMIDERLETESAYSQVPAFSAADRAMIDVLTLTRDARLAVIELKADEDIHLPLQGLDYWARVNWHHARGEFLRFGYFGGRELAPESPLLFLVAPALKVHPATDTILRYISPEIDWAFVGIDERWREGVRVVFRKRSHQADAQARRRSA